MSSNSVCKLVSLPIVAVLGVTVACGGNARTPTTPTAATPPVQAGTVSGLLRGEAPVVSRIARSHPALSNATVTVIGGPVSGINTTTGADGTYELKAAGTFKLRFEHPSFLTQESGETSVATAGASIAMPEVVMVTAPWAISGRITDSLGNPVPDAEVVASHNSFFSPDYGRVRTDAAGRYVLNSALPRFENVLVAASKPGFQPMQQLPSVKCCGEIADIRIVRIVSITPTAPNSLRVGESVEMPASRIVFDTGEIRNVFVLPESSVPTVVNVSRSTHWYAMTGYRAGAATLTFDLWGAVATVQVQVR